MASPTSMRPTNRLADETSAYLRQHMHNPVDWHPWGPEAFARARAEDKPLLLSIGYSACHWCHVMERESFEDPETAALMNRLFVNLKLDREERPDVDRLYMDFVLRALGHGGWPLTVFCTPDGSPFYGGTYFPPEPRHGLPSFRQVLTAVADAYHSRRDEVEVSARSVVAALADSPHGDAANPPGIHTLVASASRLLTIADRANGGFGDAPKFPTATNLEALLAATDVAPPEVAGPALEHVLRSCRAMARRGLFDTLGGGFHRYCVDAAWTVPHFEKMLYDQGQLLSIYAEAARRADGAEAWLWPLRETAAYLRRELAAPDGGFFASQDADSEGEEGRYYVWTPEEVREVLGAERGGRFCGAYGVTESGNFEEGRSVLVDEAGRPRAEFTEERARLLAARGRRIPPAVDPKRIAAWNAYTASGLARAATVLGDPSLLDDAIATADLALERMRDPEGRLLRVLDAGGARIPAVLDDVAAWLVAALDLHRAGADDRLFARAIALADELVTRFWDDTESDFFLVAADAERLVQRPRPEPDGATPHATGVAALGLLRAATLSGRDAWRRVAESVLRRYAFLLERTPEAFPTLARAAALAERGLSVALVLGEPDDAVAAALATRARRLLGPDDAVVRVAPQAEPPPGLDAAWLAGREPLGGRATAYVCRGARCSLPVTNPDELAPLEGV